MPAPIELYYWPTPNAWKTTIALEEMGLAYVIRPIDITKGEQFSPGKPGCLWAYCVTPELICHWTDGAATQRVSVNKEHFST